MRLFRDRPEHLRPGTETRLRRPDDKEGLCRSARHDPSPRPSQLDNSSYFCRTNASGTGRKQRPPIYVKGRGAAPTPFGAERCSEGFPSW